MSGSDPRITLARDGVATARLEGCEPAIRYVTPAEHQVIASALGVMRAPEAASEQMDQLLFGERFDVLEVRDGWAFGQAQRDGYVGWTLLEGLGDVLGAPTHWVCAPGAHTFCEPSIKTRPLHRLSMNALVSAEVEEGRFVRVGGSGWIVREHLSPLGSWEDDPAAVAERFLGVPYLWGGRDSLGLDCSGLVQQALYACGRAAPRDTDMQVGMGQPVGREGLRRNDLVFWRGHVGMMLDAERLLHANAHHMAVAIEPVSEAVTRIEAAGGGAPTAFSRLGAL
ncbi:MAG: NlpC/P60 family protein [Caulobacteraceae bacterium]